MALVTGYALYVPGHGYVSSLDVFTMCVEFHEDIWEAIFCPCWTDAVKLQHFVLNCLGGSKSCGIHPISLNCGEES
jgi:hypothetical protein